VCAGVARTYGLDIMLVRALWVLAAVVWIGIPAYVIAWIAIPTDDADADERPRDAGMLVGLALVGIGVLIAAHALLPRGLRVGGSFVGPMLLIACGVAILVLRRPGDDNEVAEASTVTPEPGPSESTATYDTAVPPAYDGPPAAATASNAAPTAPVIPAVPSDPTEPVSAWTQTAPWPTIKDVQRARRAEQRARRAERRARRPRPFLGPLTFSILLLAAGVTSFLQAIEAIEVNLTVAFALATCLVGAVLVLSTWLGRARGLIFLGIALITATAMSYTVDVPLRGGVGEEQVRPIAVAEVRPEYELAIGHMYLDFRRVTFTGETEVDASVGIGRLQVAVPSTVRVEVDAHTGLGGVNLFGDESGGWDHDVSRSFAGEPPDGGVLRLDLRVGTGAIDVHRYQQPGNVETLIGERP
jgi:phage shock protein PspC (stress-responsive transcriptional regulator)